MSHMNKKSNLKRFNNKKTVLCLFIMFLACGLSSLFFVKNVSAVSFYYTVGFEDQVVGNDYLNTTGIIHNSYATAAVFKVGSTNVRTGIKNFMSTGSGYFNFSYPMNNYITNISFYMYMPLKSGSGSYYLNIYFQNSSTSTNIIHYQIYTSGASYTTSSYYWDGNDIQRTIQNAVTWNKFYNSQFMYYFSILDATGATDYYSDNAGIVHGDAQGSAEINTGQRIDRMYITTDSFTDAYFDDISITVSTSYSGTLPSTSSQIYINAYDATTGTELEWIGKEFVGPLYGWMQFVGPIYLPNAKFIRAYITSDVFVGDYLGGGSSTSPLEIAGSFSPGSLHYLTFSYCTGSIDTTGTWEGAEAINWYNKTEYFYWYPDQTYSFSFTRIGELTYDNEYCGIVEGSSLFGGLPEYTACLGVDKYTYQYGESVLCRYKCPTPSQLQELNIDTAGYYVCFQRDAGLWPLNPGIGDSITGTYSGISIPQPVTLDGGYHFFQFEPPDPTDNIDNYDVYICGAAHGWFGALGPNYLVPRGHVEFTLYKAGVFLPSGNITSVSPIAPYLGQKITINFNANNNGKIKIAQINGTAGKYVWEVLFTKPITPATIAETKYQPSSFGPYVIEEYVWDGLNYSCVDTEAFYVNLTGTGFGEFGTAEFLYPSPKRVIAGHDTLTIIYHSLVDGAWITITDPYGSVVPFSAIIDTTPGILEIDIPSYYAVGTYLVTMNATNTISTNFSVIAMEGNWIEFTSGQPYANEPFVLLIEHTEKVSIIFYKDNQQIGSPSYLEQENLSQGFFEIPIQLINPTIGSWKVEMWEINNFIPQNKLAEHTCKVISRPRSPYMPPPGGIDFGVLIPYPYSIFVGAAIIIGFLMMPIAFVYASNKHLKTHIEIKQEIILYISVMTGFVGYVLTLLWQLFPWWSFFGLIFVLILVFGIKWYTRPTTQ